MEKTVKLMKNWKCNPIFHAYICFKTILIYLMATDCGCVYDINVTIPAYVWSSCDFVAARVTDISKSSQQGP